MKTVDLKLEVVAIPVADVERAKRFYGESLDWRLDADFAAGEDYRIVQFTTPGSPTSIHFGKGVTPAAPRSASGLFLVFTDIVAARVELVDRGIAVSEVFHRTGSEKPTIDGPDPQRRSYSSYATFKDPDGNAWLLQEVTQRLPGRVEGDDTKFGSLTDLAMRRAEAAHAEHERRTGQRDADWPSWYAAYMIAEQAGRPLPT